MNSLIAAGFLDSPWVVLVFFATSALISWISKRRQEKELKDVADGSPEVESSGKPVGEIDLDEIVRRLTGQEPPPSAVPPRIPDTPQNQPWISTTPESSQPPHVETGQVKEKPAALSSSREPRLIKKAENLVAVASQTSNAELQRTYEKARRFEQSQRHPRISRVARSQSSSRGTAYWRKRENARSAFVASIVFGPPKGLES